MEKFYLDEYLPKETPLNSCTDSFQRLCHKIHSEFFLEWGEAPESKETMLETQKKAILGHEKEVTYFKSKIHTMLKKFQATGVQFPPWYPSLEDAIFHENLGMAGMAEWFEKKHLASSSAKIIGSRIYYLEEGRMVLKPQTISQTRREQLKRAILMLSPQERLDKDFHEVYLLDGTRITIFGGLMTKVDQDVIIFRRYIVPRYTFQEQVSRGTLPQEAIPLFIHMIRLGYNCAFTGAVRSAKTTFLSTWQSYEDKSLEGVMVETDPEIPLHKLMPQAPIVQLLADHENMSKISKNLLRSDADYFILAEAREGVALDTAIRIANKGTRRMKITFHTRDPELFPYDVATEIVKSCGGDFRETANRVAGSFDYIFHFVQLKNKNQKRLKSIFEMTLDRKSKEIKITNICNYDFLKNEWSWHYHVSRDKELAGTEEDQEVFLQFTSTLKSLSEGWKGEAHG